jgi:hypothetical protein
MQGELVTEEMSANPIFSNSVKFNQIHNWRQKNDRQISMEKELLQYLTPFKSYSVPMCRTVIEVKDHSLGLLKYVFEKLLCFIFLFLELKENPFRIPEL